MRWGNSRFANGREQHSGLKSGMHTFIDVDQSERAVCVQTAACSRLNDTVVGTRVGGQFRVQREREAQNEYITRDIGWLRRSCPSLASHYAFQWPS
jgi:hypothetical protein